MGNDEPLLTGLWAIVMIGPKMLLARLNAYKTNEQKKAEGDFMEGKPFHLEPALDYFSPIQRVQKGPQVGIAREPLVMPFEFTTNSTKVLARLDMICFLDDMSNEDQKLYISFISVAEKAMENSRIERLGLVTANGPLPTHRA